MNSEVQPENLSFGKVIGQYRGQAIYEGIDHDGQSYFYARLARQMTDGSFDLAQLVEGEMLIPPGLVYKRSDKTDSNAQPSLDAEKTDAGSAQQTQPESQMPMREALGQLASFYAFHWWRIATLRPAFALISDRKENVYVFAALYWVLGLLRWSQVSDRPLSSIVFSLFFGAAVVLAVTVRPKQSLVLAAAFFAASAAVDVIAIVADVLGMAFPNDLPYVFLEVLMYIASIRAFHHGSGEVRKRGYKVPERHL